MIDWSLFQASQGDFLLSEPTLSDENFARTVVLLVSKDEEGVLGFIMNRPLQLKFADLGEDFQSFDAQVFEGGPVETNTLHYVHAFADLPGAQPLLEGVFWGGDFEMLKSRHAEWSPNTVRFFLGYSGWGVEQLEREIAERTWVVARGHKQAVYYPNPERLWSHLIRSQGGEIAALANYPQDPSWN
ncbi:MAG: YqgE/AlgH family protein [Bacteroidetes bacterium]|nr:MAG: YqgE/AlgH family protein [Bacteroidota bacterium]